MADEILSTAEIDDIVKNFEVSTLEEIGTIDWFKDRDKLYKLYQVAVYEGNTQSKERVTAAVRDYSKVEAFVKELITLSVWKEKILPETLKLSPQPEQVFPTYIVLYSEVLLVGLIQTFLFHDQLYCDLGDLCLELIDYAVAQLTILEPKISFGEFLKEYGKVKNEVDNTVEEIKLQRDVMTFDIGIGCVPLLRYIAENFESLPLSVASRMYNNHDVPLLVAHLIDDEILTRRQDDRIFKYEQSKWREWKIDDPLLSNTDCQVWLLLRQLLINSSCDSVYFFSNYRKEQLSKLVRHLHQRIIDQLSPLADLKLWLHRLSISSTTSDKNYSPLIMEVCTQFRESIYKTYDGKWSTIAHNRSNLLFYPRQHDIFNMAKGFANGLDGLDKISETLKRCTVCFEKATKRCSKCKDAWYCSRQCQVNHWQLHRKVCCK